MVMLIWLQGSVAV